MSYNCSAEAAPGIILNDRPIKFDVDPFIQNDRVMVPMRAIFEALGAEVEWSPESRSVTARYGNNMVFLVIGSSTAFRYREGLDDGPSPVDLDAQPIIVGDRTMVPVRFISESLNAHVDWNNLSKTVYIRR
ncbi:MAG: copper amine oxidase N-terminal domain-containing protein [Desulfocucumaceae bacterium]